MKRSLIAVLAVIVGLVGIIGLGPTAKADDSVAPIGNRVLASA